MSGTRADWRLESERLLLVPAAEADVAVLHPIWTDAAVRRYLWDDEVISAERTRDVLRDSAESFARHGFGQWWLALGDEPDEAIGFCGLRYFGPGEPPTADIELLYGLVPRWWGNGYASEAARRVLLYAFSELGLERVHAGADPPNRASFAVMDRLGMRFALRTWSEGREAIYYVVERDDFLATDGVQER